MTIRSLSRRLQRLEGTPKARLWIVDMKRFPGMSREEALKAFGNGQSPEHRDVVVFRDKDEPADPQWIMDHAGLPLFGDQADRSVVQILMDAASTAPQSRLSSLIKP